MGRSVRAGGGRRAGLLLAVLGLAVCPAVLAQPARPEADSACAEMERVLRDARIGAASTLPDGVTLPQRATLQDGERRHDAAIQAVDVRLGGLPGLAFRDYWGFNVAGYRLARLLGLDMVPPYVERTLNGQPASLSWWVDDAVMEQDRVRRQLEPPDAGYWDRQMFVVRVFRQLIADLDPNARNLLITKDWRIWLIDFTRAFGAQPDLPNPGDLMKFDARLLARLRGLDRPLVAEALGPYLDAAELDGLLARRDRIVKFFDDEIARKGRAAVLFDLDRVDEPCGTGL